MQQSASIQGLPIYGVTFGRELGCVGREGGGTIIVRFVEAFHRKRENL